MLRSRAAAMLIGGLILSLCTCAATPHGTALSANLGPPVYYRSDDGARFVARYGSLSDGSLHFVKVKMPDGQEYTVPQAVSASGVRYTDEREIVWWTHKSTVRVDVRDAEGAWKTRYSELREVPEKN